VVAGSAVRSCTPRREFTAEIAESAESLLEERFCVFRVFCGEILHAAS
jgi:hypothetical protein